MAIDFSIIRSVLSAGARADLFRRIFVLAGSKTWQSETLHIILKGFEKEVLWFSDEKLEQPARNITYLSYKKAKTWLGNEKKWVVYDANKDFEPDSFAAISGIIVGGGILFLLMPAKDNWNSVYSRIFGQRLINSITKSPEILVINEVENNFKLPMPEKFRKDHFDEPGLFKSVDQKQAVEIIEQQVTNQTNRPVVLVADRGRGKSAALGLSVVKLMQKGIKCIAITAPSLRSTNIVFKHISDNLPQAEISRGSVKNMGCIIRFYSPDQLLSENITADVLFVDEAAAIPVPMLTKFLEKYQQSVFATTVHGYEGTGRGFTLRFYKMLDKFNSQWIKHHMQVPVRWPENDPLEKWMFELLCLDAEPAVIEQADEINLQALKHRLVTKKDLAENSNLVKQVFSLLVLAHYRTRPKDLKSLLDDDDIFLYASFYKDIVVAVSLVIQEGKFTNDLSTEVYRGRRRITGHLLAQTITYHCGVEYAATLNYARIMRIAVHPDLQLRGIGTELIRFVLASEKERGRDIVGTSFGINNYLLDFWMKHKFELVRIGFTREQTSGENAGVLLSALTDDGSKVFEQAKIRFSGNSYYWFKDILKDIPSEIKERITDNLTRQSHSTGLDRKDIESYVKYSRNYELCIGSLNRLVDSEMKLILSEHFPAEFKEILLAKARDSKSWNDIVKTMSLTGKYAARELFCHAIYRLLQPD